MGFGDGDGSAKLSLYGEVAELFTVLPARNFLVARITGRRILTPKVDQIRVHLRKSAVNTFAVNHVLR
jgi:hypothetical protein